MGTFKKAASIAVEYRAQSRLLLKRMNLELKDCRCLLGQEVIVGKETVCSGQQLEIKRTY